MTPACPECGLGEMGSDSWHWDPDAAVKPVLVTSHTRDRTAARVPMTQIHRLRCFLFADTMRCDRGTQEGVCACQPLQDRQETELSPKAVFLPGRSQGWVSQKPLLLGPRSRGIQQF